VHISLEITGQRRGAGGGLEGALSQAAQPGGAPGYGAQGRVGNVMTFSVTP